MFLFWNSNDHTTDLGYRSRVKMHTNLWSSVNLLQCSANGSSGYIEALLNNQDIIRLYNIAAIDKIVLSPWQREPGAE